MLGDPDEAEDVVQEAFVRAWERLDHFDPAHRFYTWLFTIARNRCLNALRRRSTWGFRSLSGDDPPVLRGRDVLAAKELIARGVPVSPDVLRDEDVDLFELAMEEVA